MSGQGSLCSLVNCHQSVVNCQRPLMNEWSQCGLHSCKCQQRAPICHWATINYRRSLLTGHCLRSEATNYCQIASVQLSGISMAQRQWSLADGQWLRADTHLSRVTTQCVNGQCSRWESMVNSQRSNFQRWPDDQCPIVNSKWPIVAGQVNRKGQLISGQ